MDGQVHPNEYHVNDLLSMPPFHRQAILRLSTLISSVARQLQNTHTQHALNTYHTHIDLRLASCYIKLSNTYLYTHV